MRGEEASAIYAELYDYEHKGWLPGYYSIARYHADLDAVVVLLVCNTGDEPELIANVAYKRILRIIDSER